MKSAGPCTCDHDNKHYGYHPENIPQCFGIVTRTPILVSQLVETVCDGYGVKNEWQIRSRAVPEDSIEFQFSHDQALCAYYSVDSIKNLFLCV